MALPVKLTQTWPDLAKLSLRVGVGTVFLFHGAQKLYGVFDGPGLKGFAGWLGSMGVPYPMANAMMAAGTEFFCGLAVLIGYYARWATLPLISVMAVAIVLVHGKNGFSLSNQGFEYNFVLICLLAAIFLQGAGKYSIRD